MSWTVVLLKNNCELSPIAGCQLSKSEAQLMAEHWPLDGSRVAIAMPSRDVDAIARTIGGKIPVPSSWTALAVHKTLLEYRELATELTALHIEKWGEYLKLDTSMRDYKVVFVPNYEPS